MKNNQVLKKETDLQSCDTCEGPFEFWGTSPEHQMFRCQTCGVVHFLENTAIPKRDNAAWILPGIQVEPTSFMDDNEHLQDLNTFDFSPNDKKSILERKEKSILP